MKKCFWKLAHHSSFECLGCCVNFDWIRTFVDNSCLRRQMLVNCRPESPSLVGVPIVSIIRVYIKLSYRLNLKIAVPEKYLRKKCHPENLWNETHPWKICNINNNYWKKGTNGRFFQQYPATLRFYCTFSFDYLLQ